MLNLCYLSGKILNKVDLKFIYDSKRKSISKRHTSVVELILRLENENIIVAKGYDDIADLIYRKLKQCDIILIEGRLRENGVEILDLEF